MTYTFTPKEKFAKAYGRNMRISAKSAGVLCRVIRGKKLTQAKRLLNDVVEGRRSLGGKYYTKTTKEILGLLESCEKNADFLGLDSGRLFVHASSHQGTMIRRRRRKAAFGSRLKNTNIEVMLIERGRLAERVPKAKAKEKTKTEAEKHAEKEHAEIRKGIAEAREKAEEMGEKVKETEVAAK